MEDRNHNQTKLCIHQYHKFLIALWDSYTLQVPELAYYEPAQTAVLRALTQSAPAEKGFSGTIQILDEEIHAMAKVLKIETWSPILDVKAFRPVQINIAALIEAAFRQTGRSFKDYVHELQQLELTSSKRAELADIYVFLFKFYHAAVTDMRPIVNTASRSIGLAVAEVLLYTVAYDGFQKNKFDKIDYESTGSSNITALSHFMGIFLREVGYGVIISSHEHPLIQNPIHLPGDENIRKKNEDPVATFRYTCSFCEDFESISEWSSSLFNCYRNGTTRQRLSLDNMIPFIMESPMIPPAFGVRIPLMLRSYLSSQFEGGEHVTLLLNLLKTSLESRSISEQLVDHPIWLPIERGAKWHALHHSFLGTILMKYLMTKQQASAMEYGQEPSIADQATVSVTHDLTVSIFHTLIEHGGLVREATLAWLAFASTNIENPEITDTVTAVVIELIMGKYDHTRQVNYLYHMPGSKGRVSSQLPPLLEIKNLYSENELENMLESAKKEIPKNDERRHYYPSSWITHTGVVCNGCKRKSFDGIRHKCAHCANYNLCDLCYAKEMMKQGAGDDYLDVPCRHSVRHIFIRAVAHAPALETQKPLLHPTDVADRKIIHSTKDLLSLGHKGTYCSDCGISPICVKYFQCAMCPRQVCTKCLLVEERKASFRLDSGYKTFDPASMHAPGHYYCEITSPLSDDATLKTLDSSIYPREIVPEQNYDTFTELFYIALLSLHKGYAVSMREFTKGEGKLQSLEYSLNCCQNSDVAEVKEALTGEICKLKRHLQIFKATSIPPICLDKFYSYMTKWILTLLSMNAMGVEEANVRCDQVKDLGVIYACAPKATLKLLLEYYHISVPLSFRNGDRNESIDHSTLENAATYVVQILGNEVHMKESDPLLYEAIFNMLLATTIQGDNSVPLFTAAFGSTPYLRHNLCRILLQRYVAKNPETLIAENLDEPASFLWAPFLFRLLFHIPLQQVMVKNYFSEYEAKEKGLQSMFFCLLGALSTFTTRVRSQTYRFRQVHSCRYRNNPTRAKQAERIYYRLCVNMQMLENTVDMLHWAITTAVPEIRASILSPSVSFYSIAAIICTYNIIYNHLREWVPTKIIYNRGKRISSLLLGTLFACTNREKSRQGNEEHGELDYPIDRYDLSQRKQLVGWMTENPVMSNKSDQVLESTSYSTMASMVHLREKLTITPLSCSADVNQWNDDVNNFCSDYQAFEAVVGDIPEKYRDGLLCTVLVDPVRFPSGHVVNRLNALEILHNNSVDPYTRKPMSWRDLEDCPKLFEEVKEWTKHQEKESSKTSPFFRNWTKVFPKHQYLQQPPQIGDVDH